MSTEEILAELPKLSHTELVAVDEMLHQLLNQSTPTRHWGDAMGKFAGAVDGLPEDYAANHDHYLHQTPKR